jgi:hypothetical protein
LGSGESWAGDASSMCSGNVQAKRGVQAIPRKSAEIVLDLDATDDPLHGSQQGWGGSKLSPAGQKQATP